MKTKAKFPAVTWLAALAGLAVLAIVVGVLARDSGSGADSAAQNNTDAPAAAEVQTDPVTNPGGTGDAAPPGVTLPADPGTGDVGITIVDPATKPLCGAVPAAGVTMMFNGESYRLIGLECQDPNKNGPATRVGVATQTSFEHEGDVVVFRALDGVIFTLSSDAASGETWMRWELAK